MKTKKSKNKGQIMLLSVLLIGTSVLVFSTIAGYLMLQRLRAASNAVDSTKAIFAADSGIECSLYWYNYASPLNPRAVECNSDSTTSTLKFDDSNVSVETQITNNPSGAPLTVTSIGTAVKSKRAFSLQLNATSTP